MLNPKRQGQKGLPSKPKDVGGYETMARARFVQERAGAWWVSSHGLDRARGAVLALSRRVSGIVIQNN
jgi:hypothetical protein